MPISIGIDPGKTGAVAVIWEDGEVSLYDLNGSIPDMVDVLDEIVDERRIRGIQPCRCVLESVHAMPKQGVSSSFNFGAGWGAIQGALYALGIPFSLATPAKWQKAVGDSGMGKWEKNAARDLARRKYPKVADQLARVRDDGRAEALLMAEYARRE